MLTSWCRGQTISRTRRKETVAATNKNGFGDRGKRWSVVLTHKKGRLRSELEPSGWSVQNPRSARPIGFTKCATCLGSKREPCPHNIGCERSRGARVGLSQNFPRIGRAGVIKSYNQASRTESGGYPRCPNGRGQQCRNERIKATNSIIPAPTVATVVPSRARHGSRVGHILAADEDIRGHTKNILASVDGWCLGSGGNLKAA